MRVALVTPDFPDEADVPDCGGVAAVAACLARALVRHSPDLDLHVVHVTAPRAALGERRGRPPFTYHGIAASVWSTYSPSPIPFRRAVHPVIDSIRPDVVHIEALASAVDGRRYPAVLTVHGIAEKTAHWSGRRLTALRAQLLRMREAPARRRYRHVIAPVGYVAQHMGPGAHGRFHFIPNPIDERFFDPGHSAASAPPAILQIGKLTPNKNALAAIQALAVLARRGVEASLHLVGPRADGAYARRLEAAVARDRLHDRVEFLGVIPHEQLRRELGRTRVLLLPSFQESAPMALAEAAAGGVPAVVAPAGGAAEMVDDGWTGFVVDPRSPESIADRLQLLLQDPDLAGAMGGRAREAACRYHPARVAAATLQVYEAVAAEGPRCP